MSGAVRTHSVLGNGNRKFAGWRWNGINRFA